MGRHFGGDEDDAWAALDEATRLARASDDALASVVVRTNAADFAALMGRSEEALDLLSEVVELPGNYNQVVDLGYSPFFDGIRGDPRFEEILERRIAFEERAAREAEGDRPWLP